VCVCGVCVYVCVVCMCVRMQVCVCVCMHKPRRVSHNNRINRECGHGIGCCTS